MFRKKKTILRAKLIIIAFSILVILTIIFQISTTLSNDGCTYNKEFSEQEKYINQIWQSVELGSCQGPIFSKLTKLEDVKNETTIENHLLEMNCTGGKYSFSFTDNSKLQFPYEGPINFTKNPNLPSREFVRTICEKPDYAKEISNILVMV